MKLILPSEIKGVAKAPPSKSLTIRALAAGLLSSGESTIYFPSLCDDAQAARSLITQLGGKISENKDQLIIKGGFLACFQPQQIPIHLDCGESGLAMRLFAPIVALTPQSFFLHGQGTLNKRPMDMVAAGLSQLGAIGLTHDGYPPLFIYGPLRPRQITLKAHQTSQFLSGLLMALPLLEGNSTLLVNNLISQPYIDLTREVLTHFEINLKVEKEKEQFTFIISGNQCYQATTFKVEGDWSGAAFLLVAGAICGEVTVSGLNPNSLQADRQVLTALEMAGAKVERGANEVKATHQKLTPFDFDATDCPDLIPPLVALAACCAGRSRLFGAHRLVHKESHRGLALASEMGKIGVKIRLEETRLEVEGGNISGGETHAHHDHRIAMALAVAGLASRTGVKIAGWEAVRKSFPEFFATLHQLGGRIR